MGGVVGFPHGDDNEADQDGVDHAGGEEERHQDVIVTLGHVRTHEASRGQVSADRIGDGAADEQHGDQDPDHRPGPRL